MQPQLLFASCTSPLHEPPVACLSAHGHILTHALIILIWLCSSDCIRLLGCWVFSRTEAFPLGYSLPAIFAFQSRALKPDFTGRERGLFRVQECSLPPKEDLSSVPCTHNEQITTAYDSSSRGCHMSGLLGYLHAYECTHTHTYTYICTHI